MTAADAREQLEAAIWRYGEPVSLGGMSAILAAADHYAELTADERIAGHVADRTRAAERANAAVAACFPRPRDKRTA